jgi:tetratricopeptide (TPR) repeat protein
LVLSFIAVYLYRDQHSVDAHLASAAQAKVSGERMGTIDAYRAALKLEDNAHTRKLLAIELANEGDWTEALFQFREAEQDGENDDSLSLNIARMLDILNLPNQAAVEYQRFLLSRACTPPLPDDRCALANARVQATLSQAAGGSVIITKN